MRTGFYPYSCALSHKHKQSSLYYFLACAAPLLPATTCRAPCCSVHIIMTLVGSTRPRLAWAWAWVEDSTESTGLPHQGRICSRLETLTEYTQSYDYMEFLGGGNPVWQVGLHNYFYVTKEKMRHRNRAFYPFAPPDHSPCCLAWLFALVG